MKTRRLVLPFALMALSLLEGINVPPAEAIVGRPLTPVSVAGVARRTARRCAVGVYHCQIDRTDRDGLTMSDRTSTRSRAR
jgi:hypothetical protein